MNGGNMNILRKILGNQQYLRFLNRVLGCQGKATQRANNIYANYNNHPSGG